MGVDPAHIKDIDQTIPCNIPTGKLVAIKQGFSSCMSVHLAHIKDIDQTVTRHIALETDFNILRHRFRTYCDGILPGDVVLLDDLHGIRSGGHIVEGVGGGELVAALGAAGNLNVIGRLGGIGKRQRGELRRKRPGDHPAHRGRRPRAGR